MEDLNGRRLSELEENFIKLDRKKAEVKKFFDEYSAAVEALTEAMGIEWAFQDDEGVVYQTSECTGKYVYFDKYEILRTRRPDETKGSLSMVKARELGFQVEGK